MYTYNMYIIYNVYIYNIYIYYIYIYMYILFCLPLSVPFYSLLPYKKFLDISWYRARWEVLLKY